MRDFEKVIEKALLSYTDDTARLIRKRELPENDEYPEYDINWNDVTEHDMDDHDSTSTERSEQDIAEDDTLLLVEVIFSGVNVSQHIRKFVDRKISHDGNLKRNKKDNPILD